MATDKNSLQLVTNGILQENPIFKLALSMCPAVGISTTVVNGLMLGIAVLFVQVFSSVTISLIKRFYPSPHPDSDLHPNHCHLGNGDRPDPGRLFSGGIRPDGLFSSR